MNLKTLLSGIELLQTSNIPALEISQLAYDSRKVIPGTLFVAIRGTERDGHQYISQAISQGATAIVCEADFNSAPLTEKAISFFKVKNARVALSRLSRNFFESPSRCMKVVGITGTNGKTTISYLVEAILERAHFSPIVIGTVNFRHAGKVFPSSHTTPESLDLGAFLKERSQEGGDALVMEVSSHALDQHRVDEIDFDVCVFSNLTTDHLDYHSSLEDYFAAKAKLFRELLPSSSKKDKGAVLNLDDPWVLRLKKEIQIPVWGVSLHLQEAAVFPLSKKITVEGIEAQIKTPKGNFMLQSSLLGEFNLFNLMAATAVGIALKIPLSAIQEALQGIQGVPGRLERVKNSRGIHVFVDYAHTPDALKNVLQTLRQFMGPKPVQENAPRLITVFGCGGDRDKSKRPLMGEEVAKYSDEAIVTSDNPRTEEAQSILEDILVGLKSEGWKENENFWVEPDRKKAISLALSNAKPGDMVLIAGKGHEDYQILGRQKIHFDDREVAKECLN